ncbi:MAG TPA: hypothetical protein PLN21_10820 [Gemmatales bacterium]|nr:hypothetical protein [Gemmatales bacterium]
MPASNEPEIYGFAYTPVGVSTAKTCETKMTVGKKKAVASYITRLGPELKKKYGKREHYTPEQIRETALHHALSIDYLCWAYVIYASMPDFERIHTTAGEVCDYSGMHNLVGETFFSGNLDFDVSSVVEVIASGASSAMDIAGDSVSLLGDVDWSSLFDWA